MATFIMEISYSQIAVFDGTLDSPFNDWTDQHVAQGFSWRPGSVSFKTLIDDGAASVEVLLSKEAPPVTGERAITVPFTCPSDGKVEIASITDAKEAHLPKGDYQLLFETGMRENINWCRFTFIPNGSMEPRILIADKGLDCPDSLLMKASPA